MTKLKELMRLSLTRSSFIDILLISGLMMTFL